MHRNIFCAVSTSVSIVNQNTQIQLFYTFYHIYISLTDDLNSLNVPTFLLASKKFKIRGNGK